MYTIVIADDEEELRRAIVRRIDWEQVGFRVVGEAENGIEALELVEQTEPDLLLTDIRMPFITGIELARQVREVRPATQIAFLSGYDDFSYAQQAIQYNIISYMLKPISMDELTEKLLEIRGKLDLIFSRFAGAEKRELKRSEFLLPLLLDNMRTDSSDQRERRLGEQAEACGMVSRGAGNAHFIVLAASMWMPEGEVAEHDAEQTSLQLPAWKHDSDIDIALQNDAHMRKDAGKLQGEGARQARNCTARSHVDAVNSILKKYVSYESFFVEDRVVSVLWGTHGTLEKYLHILADDLVQSAERILGLRCSLGVSRVTDRFCALSEACRDAVNAMRYASSSERGSVRYITDEEPFSGVDIDDVMKAAAAVEEKLRSDTPQALEQYLRSLFARLKTDAGTREKRNFMMTEMLFCACRALFATVPEAENDILREDPFMQQMRFLGSSLEEAVEHFVRFFGKAQACIIAQRQKSSLDICDRALSYIEAHYADTELSLVSVSAEIGVSPNYLSSLIKKRTGRSFVDFLTQKRMDTAKRLLLTTSMRVREIAEACGYSDQHYFSYSFKKYEGSSPNLLRQQSEQNQQGRHGI